MRLFAFDAKALMQVVASGDGSYMMHASCIISLECSLRGNSGMPLLSLSLGRDGVWLIFIHALIITCESLSPLDEKHSYRLK